MLVFLVNCVLTAAIVYNIHNSFKLRDKDGRSFYKHYFISIALILSADNMLSFLLYRLPYYQLFKVSLLLWLSVPRSTGPHFVYNVYIRNIHKLFEGDIDAVVANLRAYVENMKGKYNELVVKHRKGEIAVDLNARTEEKPKAVVEDSEADMSASNDERD